MFLAKLLIVVFITAGILMLVTYKYRNPYKLVMIFGKKGSGKSTLMTKIALKALKRKRPVYSSTPIPGCFLMSADDIGFKHFPEDSVILIDEVGTIWDNRNFKNFKPEVRDYFKYQRHYKHTVYLFSQAFDIDLKLRNLTDCFYLCKCYFNVFSVARRINRSITLVHPTAEGEARIADDLTFEPWFLFWAGGFRFTYIPFWIKYFDSFSTKPLDLKEYDLIPPLPRVKKGVKFYIGVLKMHWKLFTDWVYRYTHEKHEKRPRRKK